MRFRKFSSAIRRTGRPAYKKRANKRKYKRPNPKFMKKIARQVVKNSNIEKRRVSTNQSPWLQWTGHPVSAGAQQYTMQYAVQSVDCFTTGVYDGWAVNPGWGKGVFSTTTADYINTLSGVSNLNIVGDKITRRGLLIKGTIDIYNYQLTPATVYVQWPTFNTTSRTDPGYVQCANGGLFAGVFVFKAKSGVTDLNAVAYMTNYVATYYDASAINTYDFTIPFDPTIVKIIFRRRFQSWTPQIGFMPHQEWKCKVPRKYAHHNIIMNSQLSPFGNTTPSRDNIFVMTWSQSIGGATAGMVTVNQWYYGHLYSIYYLYHDTE